MEATPLSPDSHQGFTDLSINANTLNDLDQVDVYDLIMNQTTTSSSSSHQDDVDNLSGQILSGSMDLQPPEQRASPAKRSTTKRSQKEADLLSGSAVVPRQLGRQQSSINTPNVSAQINTPEVSQNLSGYIERTVNNLDL
jgi:hypothetical protein